MDKDLFIFTGNNGDRTNNPQLKTASQTNPIAAPSIAQAALMQPTTSKDTSNETKLNRQQPLLRKRTITIGGSDQPVTSNEAGRSQGNGDSLTRDPPRPSAFIGADRIAKLNPKEDSKQSRDNFVEAKSTKRPYPPTSWKSSSTIDSLDSEMLENSMPQNSRTTGIGARMVGLKIGTPNSRSTEAQNSFGDATMIVDDPKSEKRSASRQSDRPPSRRQYTIISSNTGPLTAPTPSKDARNQSPHPSDRVTVQKAALPSAEAAYAHIFHYTTCTHTSPPKSRPLNVQPASVQYRDGLLKFPPSHLRSYRDDLGVSRPNVHVLEGACSDCDLSARRQAESSILDSYTYKLENLSIQLSLLQRDIVAEHAASVPNSENDAISTFSLPSTLELAPEATQAILEIEDQLDQLIKKRDQEVRRVWRGFTARWGPGTTQIHREDYTPATSRAQSRSATHTPSSTASFGVPSADRTLERTSTMTSATSAGTNRAAIQSTPSRQSSFATPTRASSAAGSQERYSDGTHDVNVDPSVDGVVVRGRMRVNWIRPERRETNGQGSLSRKSSRQGR